MSNLIEWLRELPTSNNALRDEAADALEAKDKEIERLQAVVDAVDYLYECWRESGDSVDWGNALPNLFEKRAALEGDDDGE